MLSKDKSVWIQKMVKWTVNVLKHKILSNNVNMYCLKCRGVILFPLNVCLILSPIGLFPLGMHLNPSETVCFFILLHTVDILVDDML